MSAKQFSHQNLGHQIKLVQEGNAVGLIFVCDDEEKAMALQEALAAGGAEVRDAEHHHRRQADEDRGDTRMTPYQRGEITTEVNFARFGSEPTIIKIFREDRPLNRQLFSAKSWGLSLVDTGRLLHYLVKSQGVTTLRINGAGTGEVLVDWCREHLVNISIQETHQ